MLEKNKPLKLSKPGSMKTVYDAVLEGFDTRRKIERETGLSMGKVRAAIHNLSFIGMIHPENTSKGIRYIPGEAKQEIRASVTVRGINSIFNCTHEK